MFFWDFVVDRGSIVERDSLLLSQLLLLLLLLLVGDSGCVEAPTNGDEGDANAAAVDEDEDDEVLGGVAKKLFKNSVALSLVFCFFIQPSIPRWLWVD